MKFQTYLVILILLILDFNWLQSNCDLETEKGGTMHKQIALLRANQIARITSDFKMDLINLYIYWYYLRLPLNWLFIFLFRSRDSFIDQKYRPKNRVVKASVLDFLWSYEDENSQVKKSYCILIDIW